MELVGYIQDESWLNCWITNILEMLRSFVEYEASSSFTSLEKSICDAGDFFNCFSLHLTMEATLS